MTTTDEPVRYLMQRPPAGRAAAGDDGADGIAISHDGQRLYYGPLASRRLYSVSVDALCDRSLDDAAVAGTVADEGDKGTGSDGLETDEAGHLYLTAYEHNAVLRAVPDPDRGRCCCAGSGPAGESGRGHPSTPVASCALPTGLDCDDPRWRR